MIVSNIKVIMKEKGKTILALADEARLAKQSIDRARGPLIRECRLSTLEAIAGALGVKVKGLFEEMDG